MIFSKIYSMLDRFFFVTEHVAMHSGTVSSMKDTCSASLLYVFYFTLDYDAQIGSSWVLDPSLSFSVCMCPASSTFLYRPFLKLRIHFGPFLLTETESFLKSILRALNNPAINVRRREEPNVPKLTRERERELTLRSVDHHLFENNGIQRPPRRSLRAGTIQWLQSGGFTIRKSPGVSVYEAFHTAIMNGLRYSWNRLHPQTQSDF